VGMPMVEPILESPTAVNVEPIVIERPVYKEVIKEIIVEKPIYIEKHVEKEIIIEKPVYKEVVKNVAVAAAPATVREVTEERAPQKLQNGRRKENRAPQTEKQAPRKVVVREEKKEEKREAPVQRQAQVQKEKKHLPDLLSDLRAVADPEKKKKQTDFFQAEKGEYAEGDEFLGVKLSDVLKLSDQYKSLLDNGEVKQLLGSNIHEERLCGIWVLIKQYEDAKDPEAKYAIYDFYIKNRKLANNWDLVDLAARNIVGPQLTTNNDQDGVLTSFAAAQSLWDKRTAVMATASFINQGDLSKSFLVAEKLMKSKKELIQSSVGWILKEAYKSDAIGVEKFLQKNFDTLSNQSMRIATEKMEKKRRKEFLKGNFDTVHI